MAELHSINEEQRLYVMAAGRGYSFLGFDFAHTRAVRVAEWAGVPLPEEAHKGTPQGYQDYLDIMAAGGAKFAVTGERCPVELVPDLVGLEGKRVEVTLPTGERHRFWAGKSAGWLPCHLEIKTRRSHAGAAVYYPPGSTVRVVGGAR